MSSNFFAMVERMKLIDRWALMNNTGKENIAEHSHTVAVIAHALALIGNKKFGRSYNAERCALLALYHDTTEVITGDMPTPVKYITTPFAVPIKRLRPRRGIVCWPCCRRNSDRITILAFTPTRRTKNCGNW